MGLMGVLDARGHYTVGKELIDQVLDKIRRVAGMSRLAAALINQN